MPSPRRLPSSASASAWPFRRVPRLKGHADALALLGNLRDEGIDARLWLPGAREAGREQYIADLETEAALGGFADAVAFTPPTDQIARAYAASNLVLQVSRKPESFGRTVLEALCVGRPVVGWNHGGVGEQLARWQPEGAVAPFDADALHRSAYELLTHWPQPPATMPDSLRLMQEATLAVYAECTDGPGR